MPDWIAVTWLAAQAACAIVAIEQIRTRVLPAVRQLPQPQIALDVWLPLALILPMLFAAGQVEHEIIGIGWMVSGAPALCAVLGVAMTWIAANGSAPVIEHPRWRPLIGAWIGVAVLLVLLGAAHVLTLWEGQCAFALGAILMWVNTPDAHTLQSGSHDAPRRSCGYGLTIAVFCNIVQGVCAMMAWKHSPLIAPSLGIMMASAGMTLAASSRLAGSAATLRLAGWTAIYGILFGLGMLSILQLLPEAYRAVRTGVTGPTMNVAHGFGAYVFEAILMLATAAAAAWSLTSPPRWRRFRRVAGAILLCIAVVLAAFRLTAINDSH